ncbi:MAG: hypothetical protein IKI57_00830 [Clostridia bacterium]|nr:hypothetical protein [Clostridia bacterium]
MADNKKSLKELKHALWLKNKKENGEINQTAKTREGKKRKAMYDRNSKARKQMDRGEL